MIHINFDACVDLIFPKFTDFFCTDPGTMYLTCDISNSMSITLQDDFHLKGWYPTARFATLFNFVYELQVRSQALQRHEAAWQLKHWATQSKRTPWERDGPVACTTTYIERFTAAQHGRDDEEKPDNKDCLGQEGENWGRREGSAKRNCAHLAL